MNREMIDGDLVTNLDDECIDAGEVHVALWYPRNGQGAHTIVVGLFDVRAAADMPITYDFARAGYTISREVKRDMGHYLEGTGEWVELAFIPAWTEVEA